MAVTGAIAERTRAILPITWDALQSSTEFGDSALQSTIDVVKYRIFNEVVMPTAEAAYPMIVVDYAAKCVALELITPGIDFWMNQEITESATGTNENTQYVDRADKLKQLREDLLKETRLLAIELGDLIGYKRPSGRQIPLLNTIDDAFLTADPQEFPRPYLVTDKS